MENSSSEALTAKLQEAVRRLAAYSRETSNKLRTSPLQKTISLFKSLISDKKREQNEVLQAVDIISRERLLIQKLKEGNQAERNLADSLIQTIEAYNQSHDHQSEIKNTYNSCISNFFLRLESSLSYQLPKIDVPSAKSMKFHYPEVYSHPIIASFSNVQLSKQAEELFRMKALALLERYGIATNPEARTIVKNTPIFTAVVNETSTCTLRQQLSLFPGQTISVMGSSELDLKTQTIHKLFPSTFYITLESTQTGFPHPSQRSGWALANQLIPESPQRPDLLHSLAQFFERKKRVTMELLPHGRLLSEAKKLLRLKKRIFEDHKSELIELHRQFAQTLLQTSPLAHKDDKLISTIDQFYDQLHLVQDPFELLIDAHQHTRDLFISGPHRALLETIITNQSKSQRCDYEFAKSILENSLKAAHEKVLSLTDEMSDSVHRNCRLKWEYVNCLGALLGTSPLQIILQYLSEDLLFPPPMLNLFERKLQAAAYGHAQDFMEELQSDLSMGMNDPLELLYKKVKSDILNDIAILKTDDDPAIPAELALYFISRHQSL